MWHNSNYRKEKQNEQKDCFVNFFVASLLSLSVPQNRPLAFQSPVKKTHVSHPEIPGFYYSYGYVNSPVLAKNKYGYMYYDMDVYYSHFTSCSNLYLIHVKGQFTSAYVAKHAQVAGDWDDFYDLDGGLISIDVDRQMDNTHVSSSIQYIASWPTSSTQEVTYTTSYSGTATLSAGLEAGVSLDNVGIKGTVGASASITISESVSVTAPDPLVSRQNDPNEHDKVIWTFRYAKFGRVTYDLDVYYLFEVKNDGNNYQDYSFKYDVRLQMDTVAFDGLWWETHQYLDNTYHESYGLY